MFTYPRACVFALLLFPSILAGCAPRLATLSVASPNPASPNLVTPTPASPTPASQTQGKFDTPLGARLLAAVDDPDPDVRAAAVFALGESGEASTPVTQRLLALSADSSADTKLRYGALAALQSLGDPPAAGTNALMGLVANDPDENIRYAALDAIGRLGDIQADATIEMLIDALDDPSWQVAERAGGMLVKSGENGAAALAAHLESDTDWTRRSAVLHTLILTPTVAIPHLAQIITATAPVTPATQALGAAGLAMMEPGGFTALGEAARAGSPMALAVLPLEGEAAVADLIDASGNPLVGRDSALLMVAALAQVGPQTIEKQRALLESLSPEDQQFALGHLRDAVGDKLDPLLISLISTPPLQMALLVTAVQELDGYPAAPLAMVPKLVEIAQDPVATAELRNAAVRALGGYGTAASEAIPMLRTLLEGADQSSHAAAAVALAQIDPGSPKTVGTLSAMLADCDAASESAATALGGLGLLAQDAVPRLVEALQCPEPVSLAAATALGSIAPQTPTVVEALLPLTKANEQAARTAVAALGHMGPAAASVLIPLLASSASETVWQDASDALAGTGVAVAPPLLELLGDETLAPEIAARLIQTLGKMGPPVEPFIRQALSADTLSSTARDRLVETLFTIGPRSLVTLDWVKLNHPDAIDPNRFAEVFGAYDTAEDDSVVTKGFAVPEALGFLTAKVRDTGATLALRRQAARALGFLGSAGAAAAPVLAEVLADPDTGLQCEAALALYLMGPEAGSAAPALAGALESANPQTMCVVDGDSKRLISERRPAGFQWLLADYADDMQGISNVPLARLLIDTIGMGGLQAQVTAPALMKAMTQPGLRRAAAEAAARVGAATTPDFVDLLIGRKQQQGSSGGKPLLPGYGADLRRAAAFALLQSSDPLDPAIAERLIKVIKDDFEEVSLRTLLAAALEARGQLDAKVWKQAGLQPPLEPKCPVWPNMSDSAIALVGYDIYRGVCVYGPAATAPTPWNENWSDLIGAWVAVQ